MKVVIIEACHHEILEKKVNEFLAKNKGVIDIKYTTMYTRSSHHYAMIIME